MDAQQDIDHRRGGHKQGQYDRNRYPSSPLKNTPHVVGSGLVVERSLLGLPARKNAITRIYKHTPDVLDYTPTDEDAWLNPDLVEIEALKEFLRPYPPDKIEVHPGSTRVNNPAHDTPDVIKSLSISEPSHTAGAESPRLCACAPAAS
jgi:hypothetical protein